MSSIHDDLQLFQSIAHELLTDEQKNPVTPRIEPSRLHDELDLTLGEEGMDANAFASALKDLVLATPKTASSRFFNQLFGGRQGKAMVGDLLAVMLNNSMYTYKVAGPQVEVEREIIRQCCELTGYGAEAGGTFSSGGSLALFMSMVMARDAADDSVRKGGAKGNLIAYTSVESHYSIGKNAAMAGIGRDQVRLIATDDRGRMSPEALKKQILSDLEIGYRPFLINATAATTVLGAYDPIEELSAIAKEHDIWLHVDGSYGGGVIFSQKYRHLVKGLELADSFNFNAHKMMGTPLTCSILLCKDRRHLYRSFTNEAEYLYQTDGDDYNLGKTSIQCGRRNDALKFWTLWKAVGKKGLEAIVDQLFGLADVARDYVRNHPDYTLYSFDDSMSVCFNHNDIPARDICGALQEEELSLVGYGTFREDEFIRLVTMSANHTADNIHTLFESIEQVVAEKAQAV